MGSMVLTYFLDTGVITSSFVKCSLLFKRFRAAQQHNPLTNTGYRNIIG